MKGKTNIHIKLKSIYLFEMLIEKNTHTEKKPKYRK